MATLLFLGASVSQLPAIREARDTGHRVVAVDGDPDAVAFPFCEIAECIDFADVERVTEAAVRHGVEGVLAISSDRAVLPAAAVSARLGLPGIGLEVAQVMTDKARMRERLALAGVPQPRFTVLTTDTDLTEVCAKVGFPAVLKPVDSGGQRGLFMVDSVEDVHNSLPRSLEFSRSGRAMLEQYIEGTELNGILVARDHEPKLLTLSDRLRPSGPGFGVGWIHSFPSALADDILIEAEKVAIETVRALGLQDGIAFPQLIADTGGTVRVVEIAARIPAGQMADLVSFGTGINLFEIAIEQALGHSVPDALVASSFRRPIAIRFLTASPGILPLGTVSAIKGLEAVQTAPGVLAAGLYFEPGTTIGPLQVDADRRGYVVATADTATRALELADGASRRLVVQTVNADRIGAGGRMSVAEPSSAWEVRRRLLALSLPLAAVLLVIGEAAMPKGLDSQSSSLASTTKQVMIAARHVGRFEAASLLIIFGLAAAAVSFSAIATLANRRGALFATIAAVIGAVALTCGIAANSTDNLALAEAAAVHPAATVAGKIWVHVDTSPFANTLAVVYFFGWMVAIVLAAIALWRSRAVPRWTAALFVIAYLVSNFASPGVIPGVPESLPFVAIMLYLGVRVWQTPDSTKKRSPTETHPLKPSDARLAPH
jgi:biotin carboxylase